MPNLQFYERKDRFSYLVTLTRSKCQNWDFTSETVPSLEKHLNVLSAKMLILQQWEEIFTTLKKRLNILCQNCNFTRDEKAVLAIHTHTRRNFSTFMTIHNATLPRRCVVSDVMILLFCPEAGCNMTIHWQDSFHWTNMCTVLYEQLWSMYPHRESSPESLYSNPTS